MSGLHSLATLIKRLEAATSRIEDIAQLQQEFPAAGAQTKDAVASDESYHALPSPPPPPPPPPPQQQQVIVEDSRSVVAFDENVIVGRLKPFVELTKSFASATVVEIVALVEKQFTDLRELIRLSSSCQKPDQKTIENLLTPLQADIEAIARAKEANRRDRDWFSHLTFISEGGPSVGWVVNPKPGPYINEIKDTVTYFGNKVMQEFKTKDPKHVEWVRGFIAILEETRRYVMEYHTTGLVWNTKGITVGAYQSSLASSASPGTPPPPPPQPPVPASAPAPAAGAAAVFAELNRGEEVIKGLRKVDKSEMTHKNPTLRAESVVPASAGNAKSPKKPVKPAKPESLAGKKPPKLLLDGAKWAVEYHEKDTLTLEDIQLNQAVNIYGCNGTTIVIKGKVNAVTVADCKKTSVLVESVVSSISVTRAQSFVLQITGSAPMIQLDATDSVQIYLSKGSLGAEITTAKCSTVNVSLPVEGEEDGVFEEQPVPEMLKTLVKDGKLVTTVVEHVG